MVVWGLGKGRRLPTTKENPMRRVSLISRFALLTGVCVGLPTLFACLDHPLKPVEYEASQEALEGIAIEVNKDVDILFVIDNSGSMGEEQANLGANFGSFISVLEAEDVEANYRIGVTTTDNGNPWCTGTSPEGGALRLSSCRSRQAEFVFEGAMTIDRTMEACLDICPHDNIAITPTSTSSDPTESPRPWLQNIEGATNIPTDISTTEAFQCFGPQGINGCGFESHLESMYKALVRAQQDGEESFGFLRPQAILSIIFVTDEVDCSYNTDQQIIFLPEGNRMFWSLPDEGSPTSAVCWNAGVRCSGASPTYDDCASINFDPDGNELSGANAESNSVLRPLSRYVGLVEELEIAKQLINPSQEILVAAIAGVNSDGTVSYQDSLAGTMNDPDFQDNFGIGPGCTSTVAEAVPPVRIREFAEAFSVAGRQNLFSVCDTDYSPALEAIAEQIRDQIRPACMPECVADIDPTTERLDPSCVLQQQAPTETGNVTTTIEACNADGSLPDGADVCFQARTDKTMATPGTIDDMDPVCIMEGWNLEFFIVRRDGVPAPGGTQVSATCQLSQNRAIDCPDLPV